MPCREQYYRIRKRAAVAVSHTSSGLSELKAVAAIEDRLWLAVRCRRSGLLLVAVPRYGAVSGGYTGSSRMSSCRLAKSSMESLFVRLLFICPPEHDPRTALETTSLPQARHVKASANITTIDAFLISQVHMDAISSLNIVF